MDTFFTAVLIAVISLSAVGALVALIVNYRIDSGAADNSSMVARARDEVEAIDDRETEIRQMLELKRRRQVARGITPLDVEHELNSLMAGVLPDTRSAHNVSHIAVGQDTAAHESAAAGDLYEEAKALVTARNSRRRRQGLPELPVNDEINRLLSRIPE